MTYSVNALLVKHVIALRQLPCLLSLLEITQTDETSISGDLDIFNLRFAASVQVAIRASMNAVKPGGCRDISTAGDRLVHKAVEEQHVFICRIIREKAGSIQERMPIGKDRTDDIEDPGLVIVRAAT